MNISLQTITPITKHVIPTLAKKGGQPSCASLSLTREANTTKELSLKKIIHRFLTKKPKFDYVKTTKQVITDMNESYDTKVVFANFYKRILPYKDETKQAGFAVGELAQKFEQIEHPEIKNIILGHLKNMNSKSDSAFFERYKDKLDFLTSMTDAVNCLDGHYSQITCSPIKYYKDIKKKGSWFADALEGKVKDSEHYSKKFVSGKKELSYGEYLEKMQNASNRKTSQTFENDIRFAPFRDFIDNYIDIYPKTVKQIYKNAYLPKISPKTRQIFEEIEKDYDCLVISSNADMTHQDALYLKEEFDLFRKAGGRDAEFPLIFDVDNLNIVLRTRNSSGVTQLNKNKITVRDLLHYDAKNNGQTVRHELIHENSNLEEITNTKGLIKAIFNWQKQLLQKRKGIKKELSTAGLTSKGLQKYGIKKKWELTPVSMEAEHPELYSEQYKEFLKKNCYAKDWFFTIEPNKYKIAQEEERIKKIQQNFDN